MISIKRIVDAQAFPNNSDDRKIYRVIGSVDVNGKGIQHEVADIDPIILLDEAFMLSHRGSPFSAHPHRGLVAISYILKGAIKPWDNIHGASEKTNEVGGVYYINAGRGIVHNESADPAFPELHWLQLWFNPGVHLPLARASTQLYSPQEIPLIELAPNVTVRVVIGSIGASHSPVRADWPVQYLHVKMAKNTSVECPLLSNDCRGFIYMLSNNSIMVNHDTKVSFRQCAEFAASGSSAISIDNTNSEPAEFYSRLRQTA